MHVIKRKTLSDFWLKHRRAEQPLRAWFTVARRAAWKNTVEVKRDFPTASVVTNERVVFNIAGNRYRLVVAIKFTAQVVFIKFLGTHAEYDRIEAATVDDY